MKCALCVERNSNNAPSGVSIATVRSELVFTNGVALLRRGKLRYCAVDDALLSKNRSTQPIVVPLRGMAFTVINLGDRIIGENATDGGVSIPSREMIKKNNDGALVGFFGRKHVCCESSGMTPLARAPTILAGNEEKRFLRGVSAKKIRLAAFFGPPLQFRQLRPAGADSKEAGEN